jgi:curved DNA-binding protein CbpA
MNKFLNRKFCEKISSEFSKDFLNQDYYTLLKLQPNASETEIRKNYYMLAKKFHPDKFKGPVDFFRKITEAYNTLKDEKKRYLYNTKAKIKIRKKQNNENIRQTSLYEEDFKKLNIEKLFFQFEKQKIKLQPDELKIYRSELERKMSRREFALNSFFKKLHEDEAKSKSLEYKIYKKAGYIKETPDYLKTYDELVKEEISNLKTKNLNENLEEIKKEEEMKEKKLNNLLYYIAGFYTIAMGYLLILHFLRKKKAKEIILNNLKLKEEARVKGYQFFG